MSITVYGASDDLIEVEGDIREEFNALDESDGDILAFSDGTILRVVYTNDGIWRITPLKRGSGELTVTQAVKGDEDNYSDRAVLDSAVEWVVFGTAWASK